MCSFLYFVLLGKNEEIADIHMEIKKVIKKLLFSISSGIADILYKRPYFDHESRKRQSTEDEILHLDLVITECCSLKCRDCSNLMQYYKTPGNISSEDVINDLKRLFSCTRVGELKILGGEPFVNQKTLNDVLRFLSDEAENKVDTINIITNGTIIPSDDCINAIVNNPKATVVFSNYGELSSKQDEFIEICRNKGIRFSVTDDSFSWLDFGRPVEYDETEEFIRRQYRNCYNRKNCNTLYRGGIYVCPRQAHGIRLKLIPDDKKEYVDIYDPHYEKPDELRRALFKLIKRKEPIGACRFCIKGKYIRIKRGVQDNIS